MSEDAVITAVRTDVACYRKALETSPAGSQAAFWAKAWILPRQYFLDHFRPFHGAPRPEGEPERRSDNCFQVAHWYVINHPDHLYVEGYALDPLGEVQHHGWAATSTGEVVDLVWPEPESRPYFGVPFFATEAAELRPYGGPFGDILEEAARRALEEPAPS